MSFHSAHCKDSACHRPTPSWHFSPEEREREGERGGVRRERRKRRAKRERERRARSEREE